MSWGGSVLGLILVIALLRLVAPNFFWRLGAPVFNVSNAIAATVHGFLAHFEDAATLARKNENLENENAALGAENRALTKQLNAYSQLGDVARNESVLAGVIVRPPQSAYDTLMIAVGSEGGANVGMEAFALGGTPIGVVTAVSADFSQVTLFSAPDVITNGWVGSKNVPLTIVGAGGGVLRASAPRSAEVKEGDVVSAPGPGMLPIGSVVRIDSDPRSPSVTLRILPVANPFSIGWVNLRDTGIALPSVATSSEPS